MSPTRRGLRGRAEAVAGHELEDRQVRLARRRIRCGGADGSALPFVLILLSSGMVSSCHCGFVPDKLASPRVVRACCGDWTRDLAMRFSGLG